MKTIQLTETQCQVVLKSLERSLDLTDGLMHAIRNDEAMRKMVIDDITSYENTGIPKEMIQMVLEMAVEAGVLTNRLRHMFDKPVLDTISEIKLQLEKQEKDNG